MPNLVANLLELCKNLERRIEKLETENEKLESRVKVTLPRKSRQVVKTFLE